MAFFPGEGRMPLPRGDFLTQGRLFSGHAGNKATSNHDEMAVQRMKNGNRLKKDKHQDGSEGLLEIRQSAVHGTGVYAKKLIRKGRRILEYTGRIVPWKKASEQADGPHTFLFGLTMAAM